MCQGMGPVQEGDRDPQSLCLPARLREDKVHDCLLDTLPRGVEVPKGLNGEGCRVLVEGVSAHREGGAPERGQSSRYGGGLLQIRAGLLPKKGGQSGCNRCGGACALDYGWLAPDKGVILVIRRWRWLPIMRGECSQKKGKLRPMFVGLLVIMGGGGALHQGEGFFR